MDSCRKQIIKELKAVKRNGMSDLIEFLKDSDFFEAPASTRFHGSEEGGLSAHSWITFTSLVDLISIHSVLQDYPLDTIRISAICHDVCKIGVYHTTQKWRKDANGKWKSYEAYEFEDPLPIGHGGKSVVILQKFIQLTEDEMVAIANHMGTFDQPDNQRWSMTETFRRYPLAFALHLADQTAAILHNI